MDRSAATQGGATFSAPPAPRNAAADSEPPPGFEPLDDLRDPLPTPPPPDAARMFPDEASPGGCATQECLPDEPVPAEPEPAPVKVQNPRQAWQAVVQELKAQKKDLLATAAANGRLLAFEANTIKLGFAPTATMFRRQIEQRQADVLGAVSKVLGRPMSLSIEQVAAEAPDNELSLAEEKTGKLRAREARIQKASRENPAVLAAMRILEGSVEHIRVLDAPEDLFTPSGDEGMEEGAREES